jgi:SecD/SecF fusion protein
MRPFFWRIVLCLTPVVLAAWATWYAAANDGFKKGVDLSGGTILVYEIDTRKQQARAEGETRGASDPLAETNLLVEALKRRLDPTGTYNFIIRPAGAGGRVEIILPTGGAEAAQKAQDQWDKILQAMEKVWQVKELDVPAGKVQELTDRIQTQVSQRIWAEKVFNTSETWKALLDKTERKWLQLRVDLTADPVSVASLVGMPGSLAAGQPVSSVSAAMAQTSFWARLHALKPGQVSDFSRLVAKQLEGQVPEHTVDTWVKQQAWNVLLERIHQHWPDISEEELQGIAPDSFEELIGRVEAKGNLLVQAALESLRPLLGAEPIKGQKQPASGQTTGKGAPSAKGAKKAGSPLYDRAEVIAFIAGRYDEQKHTYIPGNYGPSPQLIEKTIGKVTGEQPGQIRYLTVEQVQRVKELMQHVGALEFKILGNQVDDKQAEADAEAYINNPVHKEELERAAVRGEPPPGPLVPGSDTKLKVYDIELPHNTKSKVTYSWVELGQNMRKQLGLDNAARTQAGPRKRIWDYAHARLGTAFKLPYDPTASTLRFQDQGALFYAREVKDRNMPEAEKRKKLYEYFVLARNPEIDPTTGKTEPVTGDFLKGAQRSMTGGTPAVNFAFNTEGGRRFGELTGKNVPSGSGGSESQVKRHLAIILDGLVMSAPTINSRITTNGQITGSFTVKEVDSLVNILRSGALPATLKQQPVSETTIGATLGKDTIVEGTRAILFAFLTVVIFMIIYYRFAGLVASTALFANLLLTVGFMVFVHATFTLPGLAGLVLMLGMAVDANVLIYERFREERDRGASVALAIRNGYDRALPIIIDTHFTGIFTAVVLYIVGNDQLKGFGVSLTVGLIISLFTSLYMTRLIFDFWLSRGWLHKLSMFRFFHKPDFDFMGIRYYCFTFTVVVTILGITLFVARLGPSELDIDFVGGTAYSGTLTKAVDMTELRHLLSANRQEKLLDVKAVKEEAENKYQITYLDPTGKTTTREVTLANTPAGETVAQREADVMERAHKLPDLSVEQLFPSDMPKKDQAEGKSPVFNVRTSEKETELVQISLDRLLQEHEGGKWVPLMKKISMNYNPAELAISGKGLRINFTAYGEKKPAYASQGFVETMLSKELLRAFKVDQKVKLPFQYELVGSGKTQEGGKFQQMRLTFFPELKGQQLKKVEEALARTKTAFESRPAPERLENFDSELAGQVRLQAMWAILASWLVIALYLWFRFGSWTFGIAAVLCLIHDLFFTLGIIAFCHYIYLWWPGFLGIQDFKIDFTAVAALLTLVGYSVNDTIVVFDRIREVRGKNPDLTTEMINDSVNQTLSRTLLTSLTAWLVVFVLYVFGGPGVHLFGFVMVIGVIVGTYSSIYVASPLLLLFGEGSRPRTGLAARQQPAVARA